MRTCSIEGCERKYEARGLCALHYQQKMRAGAYSDVKTPDPNRGCMVDGCDRKHKSRGYCAAHIAQVRANGAVTKAVIGYDGCEHGPRKCRPCVKRGYNARNPGKTSERRRKQAGLYAFHIEADFCLVCGFTLVDDLKWPHPLSTSVGHEPPISRASHFTTERPEHLVCNVAKGSRWDTEPTPEWRDNIEALVVDAFCTI